MEELRRSVALQVGGDWPTSFADVVGRPAAPSEAPGGGAASPSEGSVPLPSVRQPDHALVLRLTSGSSGPARDIASLMKSTFNSAEIGIGPVTFRPSQYELTIVPEVREDLNNLESAITSTPVTKNALQIMRPVHRLPQIRISGVDPSIVPAMLLDQINARNNLDIQSSEFTPKTQFTEWSGNRVHVVEVSPRVFSLLRQREKLHIGWTSCYVRENFYIPTCYRCSSLGHTTAQCPAGKEICNCAGEHSTHVCGLEDHVRVVCNECYRWCRLHSHVFGVSVCPSVGAWMERQRSRTDYGEGAAGASDPR